MASIQKHGDKWRVFFYRNGVRRTKVCETKTEARRWADGISVEVGMAPSGSDVTLHQALDRYLLEVAPKHRGYRHEKIRLLKIKREIKDKKLRDMTGKDIARWRDSKTLSPASVLREMKQLNSVFNWCVTEWEYIDANPMKGVRKPQSPPARRRGVTQEEIDQVCARLHYSDDAPIVTKGQQIAILFLLSIETGMRKGEMLGLAPERIHLDKRYVELEMTKNGDRRHVPLSQRAAYLLGRLPDGCFTVAPGTVDALFRRARPAGLHLHDARSEAITRLAKKLDVLDLARMIGHRDVRSLMLYYSESATEIAARLD